MTKPMPNDIKTPYLLPNGTSFGQGILTVSFDASRPHRFPWAEAAMCGPHGVALVKTPDLIRLDRVAEANKEMREVLLSEFGGIAADDKSMTSTQMAREVVMRLEGCRRYLDVERSRNFYHALEGLANQFQEAGVLYYGPWRTSGGSTDVVVAAKLADVLKERKELRQQAEAAQAALTAAGVNPLAGPGTLAGRIKLLADCRDEWQKEALRLRGQAPLVSEPAFRSRVMGEWVSVPDEALRQEQAQARALLAGHGDGSLVSMVKSVVASRDSWRRMYEDLARDQTTTTTNSHAALDRAGVQTALLPWQRIDLLAKDRDAWREKARAIDRGQIEDLKERIEEAIRRRDEWKLKCEEAHAQGETLNERVKQMVDERNTWKRSYDRTALDFENFKSRHRAKTCGILPARVDFGISADGRTKRDTHGMFAVPADMAKATESIRQGVRQREDRGGEVVSADLNAWLDRFVAELEALAEKHPGMLDSDVRSLAKLTLPALFLAGSIPVEVRADKLHLRVGSFDFDAPRGTGSSSVTRIDGKQVRYPTDVAVHADGPGVVKVTLGLMAHRMRLMTDEEVEKESAERKAEWDKNQREKIGEPYMRAVYASPNAADPRSLCARCGSWIEQADGSHECVAR